MFFSHLIFKELFESVKESSLYGALLEEGLCLATFSFHDSPEKASDFTIQSVLILNKKMQFFINNESSSLYLIQLHVQS